MRNALRSYKNSPMKIGLCSALLVAMWITQLWKPSPAALAAAEKDALRKPTGMPQFIASSSIPTVEGEFCEWVPASTSATFTASLMQQSRSSDGGGATTGIEGDREPVRVIRDTYPTYSAVAVDLESNEVYLQDENLFGYKVFNRLDNTPPNATFTEPKRMVQGIDTKLEFNCALYVDPRTGDVYSVNNDTVNTMVIFPRNAEGNVKPKRELRTPHGTYGIAADEASQELFLTVQHDNAVVVYRKLAAANEDPIRLLQGDQTELEDPHGIALDTQNGWIFISNHGSVQSFKADPEEERRPNWPLSDELTVLGSGRLEPPSITVYPLNATGDTTPLRIIEGPRTQLNWPASMAINAEKGELYVANDADDSILVFRTTDNGNVAPSRVIKGGRTELKNPTGIFVDAKNQELWVSNMGNHRATVYPLDASGNVPPKRRIRSAPPEKLALALGNPGAVAYDTKRDEILVPN